MLSKKILAEQIYLLCEQLLDRYRDLLVDKAFLDFREKGQLETASLMLSRQNQLGLRILKLFKAASLLVDKKYPVEAVILVLSMLESVTDILYIELDDTRVKKLINHKDETKTPFGNTTAKIQSIVRARPEMEHYLDMFRTFSMIKHGNPMALLFSARSKAFKRRSWKQYLEDNKYSVETGLLTQDRLRQWWKRKKSSEEMARKMRKQEKNLGEDILSDAGSLLADAFASMARYSAAHFESESARLVEWEIKIEQAHNDLLGVRD